MGQNTTRLLSVLLLVSGKDSPLCGSAGLHRGNRLGVMSALKHNGVFGRDKI